MWLVARYAPTALFSLKPSLATSSGATTLLAPTPYALKMALLDVAYRTLGIVELREALGDGWRNAHNKPALRKLKGSSADTIR